MKFFSEKTNQYMVIVATVSTTLTQATPHNVTMLNEKLLQIESENMKIKDEIICLWEEMKKRRKVENSMILIGLIYLHKLGH